MPSRHKGSKGFLKLFSKQSRQNEDLDNDSIINYDTTAEQKKLNYKLANFFKRYSRFLTFSRLFNLFLNLLLVGQLIFYSYKPDLFHTSLWGWMNTLIRIILCIHAMLEILIAPSVFGHIFRISFFIDACLIIPFFVLFAMKAAPPDLTPDYAFYNTSINLLAVFKLFRLVELIENEVNKQLMSIFITILSLILFFAGGLRFLYRFSKIVNYPKENLVDIDYGFYEYIFFVMTIGSTVGYENPFFDNILLRIAIVVVIVVSISIIPAKSSELISILSNKSVYSRINYKRVESTEFIVLCGSLSTSSVVNFLMEFFHEDHGNTQKHCIILNPNRPDNDMENLLRDPKYEKIIVYIQGNPLDEIDLRRAQADKAKAVIIMCNKHSINPEEEDSRTILIAIYIKKFLGPDTLTKLCFQLLRTEGKSHYTLPSNKQQDKKEDQLICLEELKLSLFAKTCLCPGLVAMITNLINSAEDRATDSSTPEWQKEYWHGIGFEIYKTQLSKAFYDMTFAQAASLIYKQFNAILFGVEVEQAKTTRICINPGLKKLLKEENIGYIIAEDKEVADQIRDFELTDRHMNEEEMSNNHRTQLLKTVVGLVDGGVNQIASKMNSANTDFNMTLQKNCTVLKTKTDIMRVTYENMAGNILAKDHIIVAGLVQNLHHFVIPLRSKYLTKQPPIVILNEEKPDHKTWGPISFFPEIYFVKGSALNEKDLYRVNITQARRVVILSSRIELDAKDGDDKSNLKDKEDLLDAQTIFKYLNVTRIRRDIPIITELVHPSNISFLINNQRDYRLMKKFGYYHTETYAMGETYISSVMDTLMAQAFYNSALIGVLEQVIVGGSSGGEMEDSSNLFPLRVPTTFVGKTFGELFQFLCERKQIIVLGLYRYNSESSVKPYIVTNPPVDLELTERDMAFVLAKQMIEPEISNKWGSPLEDDPLDEKTSTSKVVVHKKNNKKMEVEGGNPEYEMTDFVDKINDENKRRKELKDNSNTVKRLKNRCDMILKKVDQLGEKIKNRPSVLMFIIRDLMNTIDLNDPPKLRSQPRTFGKDQEGSDDQEDDSDDS